MTANYDAYFTSMVERLQSDFHIGRAKDKEKEKKILEAQERSLPPNPKSTLKIRGIYFYPSENGETHHTSKFEIVKKGNPIFRRGQTFFMALRTDEREFDPSRDFVTLVFNFGPKPSPLSGTQYVLKGEKKGFDEKSTWACRIASHDKNAITLEVKTGNDACVGIWNCTVETRTMYGGGKQFYVSPVDIFLLFNPWIPNDSTYMSNFELLNEYVLEDKGKIWFGPQKTMRGRHWAFGQFQECVLPLVCIILEMSKIPFSSRGDPVLVSRALSKMVNSNDDNGLVVGRWDSNYEDGTAPSAWTGSVPILEKYFTTLKPVKYGQCWVYSGVLCTVARAIGIPCRPVTNFVSAHDTNCSLTVDIYFNEKNEEIDSDPHNPSGGKDSIWNFHVWNEVWMARADLPKGYGGWQAIDSTPQEKSEGSFQCGPASLEAIRKGQVGHNYDVGFLLSEVNADLVHWRKDESSPFGFSRMTCNNHHVGRTIMTKKANEYDPTGDTDGEDILELYKGKEGTRSERIALLNAVRKTRGADKFFDIKSTTVEDVEFDLIELDQIQLGDSFSVVIKVKNNGESVRSVQADMSAESVYYTGVRANIIKKATGKFIVAPGKSEELRMTVKGEVYMPKLVEYGIMKISGICYVDETSQSWFEEDDFQVIKPVLTIEIDGVLKHKEASKITFSFRNPLETRLTKCCINIEGPGYTRFESINIDDVGAKEEMSHTISCVPKNKGTQHWVASFSSKELIDIVGSKVVEII